MNWCEPCIPRQLLNDWQKSSDHCGRELMWLIYASVAEENTRVKVKFQGWPCVLKHFSQIDDFRSKYLEHRHFYHNFKRKIVAKLSSQFATDTSL
jgi:hypothetical protein